MIGYREGMTTEEVNKLELVSAETLLSEFAKENKPTLGDEANKIQQYCVCHHAMPYYIIPELRNNISEVKNIFGECFVKFKKAKKLKYVKLQVPETGEIIKAYEGYVVIFENRRNFKAVDPVTFHLFYEQFEERPLTNPTAW